MRQVKNYELDSQYDFGGLTEKQKSKFKKLKKKEPKKKRKIILLNGMVIYTNKSDDEIKDQYGELFNN